MTLLQMRAPNFFESACIPRIKSTEASLRLHFHVLFLPWHLRNRYHLVNDHRSQPDSLPRESPHHQLQNIQQTTVISIRRGIAKVYCSQKTKQNKTKKNHFSHRKLVLALFLLRFNQLSVPPSHTRLNDERQFTESLTSLGAADEENRF